MHHAQIQNGALLEQPPALKIAAMLTPNVPPSFPTRSAILGLGLAITVAGCTQANGLYPAGAGPGAPMPSFAPIVQEVMPAVVNVSAVQRINSATAQGERRRPGDAEDRVVLRGFPPSMLDELLRRFLDAPRHDGRPAQRIFSVALGSGFVIDPGGYVVTDDHVVKNAESVTIIINDTTEYPARVVGRDPLTDIALLKIDATGPLSYVRWGDSDTARVGDWVLAIGNPFGLESTVSSGIISGRGRDLHTGPYDDFLQIDAAMNRGNSGGPTFDLHGNVVGVNTAIYSPNGGSVGIGFAIPANQAKPIVEQLKTNGRVVRGWLGVQIKEVTAEIARTVGLPSVGGALVAKVGVGSPAAAAGFAPGDVILSANGQGITRVHDLPLAIADMPVGRMADLTIWRGNAMLSLRPVIGEMPPDPATALPQQGKAEERHSERPSETFVPVSASPSPI